MNIIEQATSNLRPDSFVQPVPPEGLGPLLKHCATHYYHQDAAPVCLHPDKSFLQGGFDPLDYIYVFRNQGDPSKEVPQHWHYVGFGLSDVYNYNLTRSFFEDYRTRDESNSANITPLPELYPASKSASNPMNGFGFELTFRVRCNSEADWKTNQFPHWPRMVMQNLARYVFHSRSLVHDGDHIACGQPLDRFGTMDMEEMELSRVKHLLTTLDPQLGCVDTPRGPVNFIQLVGVFDEELRAARRWNVRSILEMMRMRPETGGFVLVTDTCRGGSIFELNPELHSRVEQGIMESGSDTASINVMHKWCSRKTNWFIEVEKFQRQLEETDPETSNENHEQNFKLSSQIKGGLSNLDDKNIQMMTMGNDLTESRAPSRMSVGSESALMIENAEVCETRYYDSIYILMDLESADFFPVFLNVLRFRRRFSFQSLTGESLITFIPEGSTIDSLVSPHVPFARIAHWLHVYVSDQLLDEMFQTIGKDFSDKGSSDTRKNLVLPRNYSWSKFKLHLTIVQEIQDT